MTDPIGLIDVRAHRAHIGDEIDRRIAAVVDHGQWIMGPEVREFEEAVQTHLGGGVTAIGCGNGTDALVLAFDALGLQPGDGVICPSFTFVATAEAVVNLGGIPIFADVEPGGFNLDPVSVRAAHKAATDAGQPVVGICAVDLFGQPADTALRPLADELGCWLVADAAQSFGASTAKGPVGTLAPVTTTSFFPAKPLGCYGDGGMVLTTDESLVETITSLRVHGKGRHKYENVRVGYNSRLDTMQAAILLPKLAILDAELEQRQRVADRYQQGLAAFDDLVTATPVTPAGDRSAWAQYTIVTEHRSAIQEALGEQGIGSAVYYPLPLHRQPAYQQFHRPSIGLDRSDELSERVLSLPMHPYLTDDQVDRVIEAVGSARPGSV